MVTSAVVADAAAPLAPASTPLDPASTPLDPASTPLDRIAVRPPAPSAASLWRGTLIGAAAGFVAGVVAWQLIQEEDDDSLLNGYAAGAGIVGGGLIGLGVAIVF